MRDRTRAPGLCAFAVLHASIAAVLVLAFPQGVPAAQPESAAAAEPAPPRDPAQASKDPASSPSELPHQEPTPTSVRYMQELTERILQPRRVLGTNFHGQVLVDALLVKPGEAGIDRDVDLRRARVLFERQLRYGWDLRGSAELVSGSVELKDLFVRRHFGQTGTITFGNQTEPMGLDELTSALDQPFMESSLPTALAPKRNFGVMASNRHDDFLYQVGGFGAGTQQDGDRDRGNALTGRLTHRRVDAAGDIHHAGVALSYRDLDGRAAQFRSLPEIGIDEQNLVDTGTIDDAEAIGRITLEYIRTFGPWSVQGEVYALRLPRVDAPTAAFRGAYIEASRTLHGPNRLYADASGVFTRAPVDAPLHWRDWRGRGVLEASARLSRIDLSDEGIDGGTQTNVSLGLTWDVGPRTRLAANAVHFLRLTGPNAAAEGGTALALRFQYAW